jgi:hypothetical protein
LKLRKTAYDMALVFADNKEDLVPLHLQASFERFEHTFLYGCEHDASTHIMFTSI